MNSDPELRLSKLIWQRTEGEGKVALNRLAELINEANRKAGTKCSINRKILARIKSAPKKVGLTWNILVALNTYFKELQQKPVFVTPGVLDELIGTPKVVFMLGAKARPEERRNDVSHWDGRSLAELLTRASKLDSHHEFEIEYVLWRSPVKPEALASESWFRILGDDESSVVSIGSPMAALSSEVMLARMFGVEPFTAPRFKTGKQVPFFFVWLPKATGSFRSAFGLTWQELQSENPKAATEVKSNRASAFILEGTTHKVPVGGDSWTMHGIIAAQRRAAGNVWLVVSGLAGPATYAAATMVKEIVEELPWSKGHPSKVLWVPVKVEIRVRKVNPLDGDVREVVHAEFDGPPRIWPEEVKTH